MPERVLSQKEIDSVFRNLQNQPGAGDPSRRAQPYDFRRPDRIAKEQLRSIHILHENLARSLGSSLSAYLRAYVIVNLVSVEQLSFMEFLQCLPSPTCMVSLGMSQFDNNALLELSPSIVFPVLEMLLGSTKVTPAKIDREITEIEQSILDSVIRIILRDLREAWRQVATIDFNIENFETEPQLLQVLAPNEAVLAISIEVRLGDITGMMNLALPSITVKMLGQKFDQQWTSRKSEATETEQARVLRLIRGASMGLDARLRGPTLSVENLLQLETGDVLMFDYPVDRMLDVSINGKLKFKGNLAVAGRKRAMQLHTLVTPHD
ncbi:MAG: flagellar motor switch protein FliM [Bryobacteraceae bacterium]|nr:flagellar motor switch protein FliM [Bryobacteraceae bacterium]